MKHLGDITKISGYDAPAVDVIIGGSPCQDLSIAGKRAGLAGARSGLYMEQIRIIKEMREADVLRGRTGVSIRPRFMVWENVPGAFSSNKGQDFAAVLEEAIRVAEPQAPAVSVPERGWPTSGCFFDVDGRWSVAWRVLDAQFWGVPQRRRRIALVADFGGLAAPEILFIRKSVSGYPEPGEPEGKETAGAAGEGTGGAVPYTLKIRGGCVGGGKGPLIQTDKSATLSTLQDQTVFQPVVGFSYKAGSKAGSIGSEEDKAPTLYAERHDAAVCYSIENHPQDSRVKLSEDNVVQTLSGKMGTGGGNVPMVMEMVLDDQGGQQISVRTGGKSPTLRAETHGNIPCVMKAFGDYEIGGVASTVKSRDHKDATDLVVSETPQTATYQKVTGPLMANSHPGSYTGQDAFNDMLVAGVDCRNATETIEKNGTLQAKSGGGSSLNYNQVVRVRHIVRRLTPLEYERLQGYPDGWTSLPQIADMTDEEYDFWKIEHLERAIRELRARDNADGVFEIWRLTETEDENGDTVEVWENTHKPYKHKTKAQMVTWYNKMVSADSAQYKALGNSIALPPWKWILKRLCACYERDATMASLFDGIGGFLYLWEQFNGEGSCLWASEIEEFPMAVTKFRFGG